MLHQPLPANQPSAVLPLAALPRQRAPAIKRRRAKPKPDEAKLLALGREWEASVARQDSINAAMDAAVEVASPAFEALLNEMTKQAEVSTQIRRRIVQIRATTWPGVLLKIALTSWAYDVGDEEFAEVLQEDKHVVANALTMSLCRDLRTWFAQPNLDEELLALGRRFEAAWAAERTLYREQAAAPEANQARFEPLLDAATLKTKAIADQIAALPAITLDGFRLKARAFAQCWDGDPSNSELLGPQQTTDGRLVSSIMRDLSALDGRLLPMAERAAALTKAA